MGVISYNPPPPTPKQEQFLLADARYIAYGGARGGGKSHAVRLKAALLALTYAGIRIIIIRRTYPELLENHIRRLSAELSGIAVYKEVDKSLTFPNGSRIVFGYCSSEADVLRYQGQEYDILMIDEATQLTEYQFTWLDAMVRGVNEFPKRTYLTCNPGGVGHDHIKRRFVKGNNPDTVFIQASVYDNPALMESDPDYVRMLKELPDGLRQAWLDGDWDYFVGQYFTAFRADIHVMEPIEIPKHWRRYRAIDYGLDMLACLWIAVSPQNECYVYREFCQPELIASDAAHGILSRQAADEDIYLTYAPPDLWSRAKDTGRSIFELFRDNGVTFVRSDAARVPGWLAVAEWLKLVRGADGGESSRLHIFSTCTELIRCLPLLQHDAKNPSDCATEPHDITHVCISGDTLICTTDGEIPIRDLVGKKGKCYCWNGKEVVTSDYDYACMTNDAAEVYEIEMEDGTKFKATANHKVLTAAGWKEVQELSYSDDVLQFSCEIEK